MSTSSWPGRPETQDVGVVGTPTRVEKDMGEADLKPPFDKSWWTVLDSLSMIQIQGDLLSECCFLIEVSEKLYDDVRER